MSEPFDVSQLKPDQLVILDGKQWGWCRDCHKVLRMDGWLRGWHLCLTDEERQQRR